MDKKNKKQSKYSKANTQDQNIAGENYEKKKFTEIKRNLAESREMLSNRLVSALGMSDNLKESESKSRNIEEASNVFKTNTVKTRNTSKDKKIPSLNPHKDRKILNLKDISEMRERGEFNAEGLIIDGEIGNGNIKDHEPYLLSGFNLTKATIRNLNLNGAILIGTNLTGAKLSNVNLDNSTCDSANFSGAVISNTSFIKTSSVRADFNGAKLESTFFKNADLKEANLSKTKIENSSLEAANCNAVNFRESFIKSTSLKNTNCKNADFSGTEIAEDVICKNTYHEGAKFENANIKCSGIKLKKDVGHSLI